MEETEIVGRLIAVMRLETPIRILVAMVLGGGQIVLADPGKSSNLNSLTPEAGFAKTVQPFLSSYCIGCHNSKNKTANLDLQQFTSVESVRANLKVWKKVAWKLEEGEMPPAKTPQPKAAAHRAMLKWIKSEIATTQK